MKSAVRVTSKKGVTAELFDEMLRQVKLLLTLKGGCSQLEIRKQFRNLRGSVVEAFISEAIERGIIEVDIGGTFSLRKF